MSTPPPHFILPQRHPDTVILPYGAGREHREHTPPHLLRFFNPTHNPKYLDRREKGFTGFLFVIFQPKPKTKYLIPKPA